MGDVNVAGVERGVSTDGVTHHPRRAGRGHHGLRRLYRNRRLFTGRWAGRRVIAARGRATTWSASCRWAWAGTSTSATSSSSARRRAGSTSRSRCSSNWAADSAAQDYIIANVILFPLWTIVDGRRRGIRGAVGLLRDEPVHQLRLLDGRLPGGGRAAGALRPGLPARRLAATDPAASRRRRAPRSRRCSRG